MRILRPVDGFNICELCGAFGIFGNRVFCERCAKIATKIMWEGAPFMLWVGQKIVHGIVCKEPELDAPPTKETITSICEEFVGREGIEVSEDDMIADAGGWHIYARELVFPSMRVSDFSNRCYTMLLPR